MSSIALSSIVGITLLQVSIGLCMGRSMISDIRDGDVLEPQVSSPSVDLKTAVDGEDAVEVDTNSTYIFDIR